MISTQEIIVKGEELNILHAEYINEVSPQLKKSKWRDFYSASENYRKEVQDWIKSSPNDISSAL